MDKPQKGARKITVNDKRYWWLVARGKIIIWSDTKHVFDLSEFTGWSWSAIERGKWKRYFSITPKYVAEQIKERKL
jgi:hypothetical protein